MPPPQEGDGEQRDIRLQRDMDKSADEDGSGERDDMHAGRATDKLTDDEEHGHQRANKRERGRDSEHKRWRGGANLRARNTHRPDASRRPLTRARARTAPRALRPRGRQRLRTGARERHRQSTARLSCFMRIWRAIGARSAASPATGFDSVRIAHISAILADGIYSDARLAGAGLRPSFPCADCGAKLGDTSDLLWESETTAPMRTGMLTHDTRHPRAAPAGTQRCCHTASDTRASRLPQSQWLCGRRRAAPLRTGYGAAAVADSARPPGPPPADPSLALAPLPWRPPHGAASSG